MSHYGATKVDEMNKDTAFVRTLGRLGIVHRSYFLMWNINWDVAHGQGD